MSGKSSKDLLKKIEIGELKAITSITSIMEIVYVFRVRGKPEELLDSIPDIIW